MSKLPIFEHFLSVGIPQAKTQVVFQAKTQANIFLLDLIPDTGSERQDADHERRRSEVLQEEAALVPQNRRGEETAHSNHGEREGTLTCMVVEQDFTPENGNIVHLVWESGE